MPVVPVVVRVAVILLAVAGIAGHVAYLDALWWHALGLTQTMAREVSDATIMLLTAHAVVSISCSVLAVMLVLHERRRAEAARSLGTAFGAWSYLMAYSGVTMLLRPVSPGVAREIFEAHFLVIEMIGLAALLRFTARFPRHLGADELRPSPTLPAALHPVHRFARWMRRPFAPWVASAATLVVLWSWTLTTGGELSDAGLSPAMDLVRFGAAGIVVMHLHRAWSAATEGDRDGLMWLAAALGILLGALALLIGGNVLVAVTGFPEPDVAWRPILLDVGTVGFFTAGALSILSRGRVDPSRLTRRVTSGAIIATLGLFLAAGLEAFFTGGLLASYSLRGGVGTAVALAVVLSTYRSSARAVDRVIPI